MEDSLNKSLTSLVNTSRRLMIRSSSILKLKVELSSQLQKSIVILSAGDPKPLSSIEPSIPGSSKSLTSRTSYLRTTTPLRRTKRVKLSENAEKNINLLGSLSSFKSLDSTIGLKMLRIGASLETDTGVTLSPSGYQKTLKKWFVLAPLKN